MSVVTILREYIWFVLAEESESVMLLHALFLLLLGSFVWFAAWHGIDTY